jgi:GNAT superfamily N-acetyltransferase
MKPEEQTLRPDQGPTGPTRPSLRDVQALNRVFSEAFTDRYLRDGLAGVRVPYLNPMVWRYAIEDAGDGAMIWHDADGQIAGFNMVHLSGAEGWMGPLAVRPDLQGHGLGSTMVRQGISWLRAEGARVIGLETMPRTVENIGFYSRLGLVPGPLTITLVRDTSGRGGAGERLGDGAEAMRRIEECQALTSGILPGVDYSRELLITRELSLGDTSLVRRGGELVAFALWHSAPLAAGRPKDELRVLKLVATDLEALQAVVDQVEAAAAREQVRRVAIRCQTRYRDTYRALMQRGYRVHWTDLRMTLHDAPEAEGQGIVMSNWEI